MDEFCIYSLLKILIFLLVCKISCFRTLKCMKYSHSNTMRQCGSVGALAYDISMMSFCMYYLIDWKTTRHMRNAFRISTMWNDMRSIQLHMLYKQHIKRPRYSSAFHNFFYTPDTINYLPLFPWILNTVVALV